MRPLSQMIIPSTMVLPREKFADAIRRVSLLSTERSKGIKLDIQKDKILLFSSNPEIGEARDEVEVEYTGGFAGDRI